MEFLRAAAAQLEIPMSFDGVILSEAALQAERRISRAAKTKPVAQRARSLAFKARGFGMTPEDGRD